MTRSQPLNLKHNGLAYTLAGFALLTLSLTQTSHAQTASNTEETPWYQVEVLIFTQPQQDLSIELWDLDVHTELSEERIELATPNSASPVGDEQSPPLAFELLPASQRSLPVNIDALDKRSYQVLFHEAWQQPLLPREKTLPIHIHNQPELYAANTDDVSEAQTHITPPAIDGEITLDIARYLHLRTNLYYTIDAPDYWRITQQQATAPEPQAQESNAPWQAFTQQAEGSYIGGDGNSGVNEGLVEQAPQPQLLTVNLKQARRMRGDEVHYLDHPLFGMVIRLSKIEPPVMPEAASAATASETAIQDATESEAVMTTTSPQPAEQ